MIVDVNRSCTHESALASLESGRDDGKIGKSIVAIDKGRFVLR